MNTEAPAEVPATVGTPFQGPHEPKTPRMVDPDPKDVVLCAYPDTLDGFVAAWVVRRAARTANIPVEFQKSCDPIPNLEGRNIVVIGPTVVPDGARSLVAFAQAKHAVPAPLPFKSWERTFPFGIKTMSPEGHVASAVCDATKSLALLAWDFFNADRIGFEKPPRLIEHLNDYVAAEGGKFKYADTPDIWACLDSYDRDFQVLDKLIEACDDRTRRDRMIVAGQGINRMLAKLATLGTLKIEIQEPKK